MQQNSVKDALAIQRKEIIAKYNRGPCKNKSDDWENPQYNIYAITDYYGFIHDEGMTPEFQEKEAKIKRLDCKREMKWRKLIFKKHNSKSGRSSIAIGSDLFSNILNRMNDSNFREEITKRIYKGIPQQFKSSVWHVFLESNLIKHSKPKVYQNMLKKALEKSPDVHQIDLDVNRTFRSTTYFRERYNDRQRALLHVLAAYSMYNTEIGYCQGMSEIAGLLLMYLVDEEDVFWGLSQLMTAPKYSMHGVFVAGFPRLLTFFNHLNTIIHKLLPKVFKHFEKLEIMASSYALKWFMQCYLDRVPLTLFLRLWDIYLLEGEKLLIAMAYNILKMHKKRLIKMDHGSILQFFQTDLRKDFLYEDDLVIESLKNCIEELKKHKLSSPGPPKNQELPCKPFGTDIDFHTPSPKAIKERQIAQANPAESIRRSLKKSQNKEITQPSQTKLHIPEEKDRPSRNQSQEVRSRKVENNNNNNNNNNISMKPKDAIPSHIQYRIINNSSKVNKSKSLHLSEEIKIEDGQKPQGVTRKNTPPDNRSLTKSVPDLSDNILNNSTKSNEIVKQKLNSSNDNYSINNPSVLSTCSTVNYSESNHLSSRARNSIIKSKTTSTLNSMQQASLPRPIKRRPISSTSPETIL